MFDFRLNPSSFVAILPISACGVLNFAGMNTTSRPTPTPENAPAPARRRRSPANAALAATVNPINYLTRAALVTAPQRVLRAIRELVP
jgi:hypothetical protein